MPRPPHGQAIAKPCKFVRREVHLLKRGVQGDTQELDVACRQDQLLRREGDIEVTAEVLESLQVAGARSMGGPCQKIIIEVMEDAAAPANVYGNPVKLLRELSKKEGEEWVPKGSRRLTYTRGRRKAWRMSAFATNAATMATAASTEVYRTTNSSRGMPKLTEAPLGEDKSKTRHTEPLDLSTAPRGEQWKSRNGGQTKRPTVCPWETSRATAAVAAEWRERTDSRLRGRVGVTGPWYPSTNLNVKPDQR